MANERDIQQQAEQELIKRAETCIERWGDVSDPTHHISDIYTAGDRMANVIADLLTALAARDPRPQDVGDRVESYLIGAMRSSAGAALNSLWERGRRAGLQEALNSIIHERQAGDPRLPEGQETND